MSRTSPRRRSRPIRTGAAARPPALRLDGPPLPPESGWIANAAWCVIALATVALLAVALGAHPIGDYLTESDFYGGYVEGARLLQRGHVYPDRYGIYGPVYELVLALIGLPFFDLFTVAKLLSVACSTATMAFTFVLLARRVGPAVGLWAVLFLAANPVFFRYGFSATTDALAVALQSGCMLVLAAGRDRRAPMVAGVLAALSTFTRYSASVLVPAAIACYALLDRPAGLSRRRAIGLFLGGFAALTLPWLAFSLSRGYLPGQHLLATYSTFYANPDASRNIQDLAPAARDSVLASARVPAKLNPGRLLSNLAQHVRLDLATLLSWPVASVCGLGLLFALRDRIWRPLASYWTCGALLFGALVPVFYSDRYALAYLPAWMSLAGVAVGSPRLAVLVRGVPLPIKWVVALVPLALSVSASVATQRHVLSQQPIEVLAAGRALRMEAPAGARVVSRKGHIGYYSGLVTVSFPVVDSLSTLAAYCRRAGAQFLYFSWYEGKLRPAFWYLLDTTATLPGLSVVTTTARHPSVVYRIGPDFGREPEWLRDPVRHRLHVARAHDLGLGDEAPWPSLLLLSAEALDSGRLDDAARRAAAITRAQPALALGWLLTGEVALRQGRTAEARAAFARALELAERSGDRHTAARARARLSGALPTP